MFYKFLNKNKQNKCLYGLYSVQYIKTYVIQRGTNSIKYRVNTNYTVNNNNFETSQFYDRKINPHDVDEETLNTGAQYIGKFKILSYHTDHRIYMNKSGFNKDRKIFQHLHHL